MPGLVTSQSCDGMIVIEWVEMDDFNIVDLRGFFNGGFDARDMRFSNQVWIEAGEADLSRLPVGYRYLLGIPFEIVDPAQNDGRACMLIGQHGAYVWPGSVVVPLGVHAHWLIFLHTALWAGEAGTVVARYILHYADGSTYEVPIRTLYEIAGYQGFIEPAIAFLAWQSPPPQWPMTTVSLHALQNPCPHEAIRALELVSGQGHVVVLVALTLGRREEWPIQLLRREELRIASSVAEPELDVRLEPGDIMHQAVDVDDPSIHYVTGIAPENAILQVKSATGLTEVSWLDTARRRTLRDGLEIAPRHKGWTAGRVRVLDDRSGQCVPARVAFRAADGDYLPPVGHPQDVPVDRGPGIGGNLVQGDRSYAYVPGAFDIKLPLEMVDVEVHRGFEFDVLTTRLEVRESQDMIELVPQRRCDMRELGWVSADTHVHFLAPTTAMIEGRAEGLNIVNVLAWQQGQTYMDVECFTGAPDGLSVDDTLIYVGQESRHHFLGHISLLGLQRLIYPLSYGGPREGCPGGLDYPPIARIADQAHEQGGFVIASHFPVPGGELPVDIALGKIDAVELKKFYSDRTPEVDEWYRYLNAGFRLTAVGGTDKMHINMPIGGIRTYAYIGPNVPLTYETWLRALRRGRTFTTSGPLLLWSVASLMSGDILSLPPGGDTVPVEVEVDSPRPFERVEIVRNGHVVADASAGDGECRAHLSVELEVDGSCWLAARCWARDTLPQPWPICTYAHTTPVYVCVGQQPVGTARDRETLLERLERCRLWVQHHGLYETDKQRSEMMALITRAGRVLRDWR
jgi:hypothetical protein